MKPTRLLLLLGLLACSIYLALPEEGRAHFLLGTPGYSLAAVTVTRITGPGVSANPNNQREEWTVAMTADGDTGTGAVSHNMGTNGMLPSFKYTPMQGTAAGNSGWPVALPWFATASRTQWALNKTTNAGSGVAGTMVNVIIDRN